MSIIEVDEFTTVADALYWECEEFEAEMEKENLKYEAKLFEDWKNRIQETADTFKVSFAKAASWDAQNWEDDLICSDGWDCDSGKEHYAFLNGFLSKFHEMINLLSK